MPLILNGTTGVSGVDGSAGTPSYQGTDTNTGIFYPAADTIAFAEGGAEVMRIDSSGNVGIGTSSPATRLDVSGTFNASSSATFGGLVRMDNNREFQIRDSGGTAQNVLFMFTDNNVYLSSPVTGSSLVFRGTGYTERMRITSAGNVGIATSSPSATLHVVGSGGSFNSTIFAQSTTADMGVSIFSDNTAGTPSLRLLNGLNSAKIWLKGDGSADLYFGAPWNATTPNVVFQGGGNVGIGTSSPSTGVQLQRASGNTYYRAQNNLANADFGVDSAGTGILWNNSNYPLAFGTNNTERMRITSGGNLLIGDTGQFVNGGRLHVRGTDQIAADFYRANSGASNTTITRWVNADGGGTVIASITTSGALAISGALSKGSGSFRIDHPLPQLSETHQLVHSFVEAPQADNIYRGKVALVNGRAEVNIDQKAGMTEGTFVALNRDVQCFTSNETDWDAVRGSVVGNILTIECQNQNSTAIISWLVIGERQDKHMYETDWTDENGKVIVEPLKKNKQ